MTTETIRTQLSHRTIRKFTGEPIAPDTLAQLFDVAMHTPSSLGMQGASIIHVTQQALKDRLAEIGNQPYVKDATGYLLFIVDTHRNDALTEAEGARYPRNFISGFTDACLMAQNVCVAAESVGLGVNFYGNVHNDARAIIELLQLPELTFPVVGMGLGWPNQNPQLKPRLPRQVRVMENHYVEADRDLMAAYDTEMTSYYDLRNPDQPVKSFSTQVTGHYSQPLDLRDETLKIAREQGFDV
ncbi:NADPH-dependent oxidoreductase [Corynebacterium epidermidicanis]|uniref:Nitroreductase n=1 Tax=Corynebacterium epidermidicanis TaxID=1050174 RepID=A0A0G3GSW7_9CORY|nr:NADPH-dependent oxidoreductase [Corynebacterium epidermidicanis]AKK04276.1 nitroreductase [Corynebacterium epidermidicanis]